MSNNLHQTQSHEILRSWQSQRNDVNHHKDFVLPMFIGNDDDGMESIVSMPGVYRYGGNKAIEYLEPLVSNFGLRALLLFPVVTKRDNIGVSDPDHNNKRADSLEHDITTSTPASSSSSRSSRSSSPPSQSSFSSCLSMPVYEEEHRIQPILPERLMDGQSNEPAQLINAANSQNPFLNQADEEDQYHLLGDQVEPNRDTQPARRLELSKRDKPAPYGNQLDISLIKSLALKANHNPVLRLIPRLREKFPQLLIICDVCLCAFTSTGHCCLFDESPHGRNGRRARSRCGTAGLQAGPSSVRSQCWTLNQFPISNKITCHYLAILAVEYALSGCNVVAPSDMMDGRIQTIRDKLDSEGLQHVSIMSYSAKFASAFYGPFRQATNNAPEFGDRQAYQLPPGSRTMSYKAVHRDIQQGADFVMVKPAGPYLDIVRDIRDNHPNVPIAVYQVSGEYSMLKLAAQAGVLDLRLAVNEMLAAFRRAGANIIITYFTPELLRGEL